MACIEADTWARGKQALLTSTKGSNVRSFLGLVFILFTFPFAQATPSVEADQAVEILRTAAKRANDDELAMHFTAAADKLAAAHIQVPKAGETFSRCKINSVFIADLENQTIWICDRMKEKSRQEQEQVFVRAAFHLNGFAKECAATLMELTAMRKAGASVIFYGQNANDCNLR